MDSYKIPHVVIVGAGFGGLQAATTLKNKPCTVTVIDKTNHHLFQPLLYQVATAALSPADIAAPVRTILRNAKNITVEMDEVTSIDTSRNVVFRKQEGELTYDYLILSPGTRHSYFGNNDWEEFAPGLKSLNDALIIRRKILKAYEKAKHSNGNIAKHTTFVVVGGGPTGVEIAGALAEIGRQTMLQDFPELTASDIRVVLVEAGKSILSAFPESLSKHAQQHLLDLGVEVQTNSKVQNITQDSVTINGTVIETENVIWAAGNTASDLLKQVPTTLDSAGRVVVQQNCSVKEAPNVFVIGDAAHFPDTTYTALPGVAQVAMQQGRFVAKTILSNNPNAKFVYNDKGNMATIGRAKAVAYLFGKVQLWGFAAWAIWALIHVVSLIKFRNRVSVMSEWLWYYVTYQPGARLIIEEQ